MARVRNFDPGFFTNEELVELPFEYRLLFAGLWTLADREGRLEDRPKRIRMELFPCDAIDVDAGLQRLHDAGLVARYNVDGAAYLWIPKFLDHQRPHPRETPSRIPAYQGAPQAGQGRVGPVEHEPEGEPKANLRPAQGEPKANQGRAEDAPRLPDFRTLGVSERGEEKEERAPRRTPPPACPDDVDPQHWRDWLAARKAKRAVPVNDTVMAAMRREAASAGITLGEAVRISAERSWIAFNAGFDWQPRTGPPSRASPRPMTAAQAAAAALGALPPRPNHLEVVDVTPPEPAVRAIGR